MIKYIDLIEDYQEWQLRLVKDRKAVEHVAHECVGVLAANCVGDVEADCWKGAAQGLCYDLTGGRLRECFNLTRRVHDDVVYLFTFLLD